MNNGKPAKKARGTVFVKGHICKGCSFCIDFCPTRCLEFSREFNAKGYHFPVLIRPDDCTGCGMCANYCPDFAIHAIRLPAASGDQPAAPPK